jgi:ribonuclease R
MHIKESLLRLLKSKDYKPLKREEIGNVLRLKGEELEALYQCIQALEDERKLEFLKKGRIQLSENSDYLKGTIKFKQNGTALFFPEDPINTTVYSVEKKDTNVALQGDSVLGRIIQKPKRTPYGYKRRKKGGVSSPHPSDQNPLIRILKVVERASDSYIGTFKKNHYNEAIIIADDPYVIPEFIVSDSSLKESKLEPKEGDKVVFELLNWSQRAVMPEAKIIRILGQTHEPMAEFKAILHKYHLNPNFPKGAQSEADNFPQKVGKKDTKFRLDFRNTYTFTIDPDDAKDFDDALSIRTLDDQSVEIGIHIADVSAYVKPKSALDIEAQERGNSTYLVGTVIPMLPHSLSNGLCSLVEAEDRLTKSVIIEFNTEGDVQKVRFANTIIRSNKRLTYRQALAFMEEDDLDQIKKTPLPPKHQTGSIGRALERLENKELGLLQKHIRTLWKIASKLRAKRFKKGSLDLDMDELKIYVAKDGSADRLEKQTNDESHQLIEEYMLLANEQIARLFKRERMAGIYRVHDKPEEDKLNELKQTMLTYGVPCGNLNKSSEMARLLTRIKDHPQSYALKLHVLKSLKQAQYRSSPDGHYGLAKADYTHFTSPIRRYSDLVVHRILDHYLCKSKSEFAIPKPDISYKQSTLQSIAQHLSITERNSVDAERESVKVKLLEYFEKELNKNPPTLLEAIITDVKRHGLFIELLESQAFGMVHTSNLGSDHYYLSSNEQDLIGKKSREVFTIGQKIKVFVIKVDRFKRQIDFKLHRTNKQPAARNQKTKNPTGGHISARDLNALRKSRRAARKK